jgi:molybdate transport system substrate-binding protein
MKTILTLITLSLLPLALTACRPNPAPPTLTVAAASDLQFAFNEIGAQFTAQTGIPVTFTFGSTGQLAQQIENGAPFDLFAAANLAFVEDLNQKGHLLPESIALYGRGRIVLAVNNTTSQTHNLTPTTLPDLLDPRITHIAIANPTHAPYGKAAQEALESSGLWDELQPKLVYGENVRQTLQFVQTGDAQVGIVALSVADVPEIHWVLLDETLHNPLDQALAVVARSPHPAEAQAFADFINGSIGRSIMQKYGFVLPSEPAITP